MANVPYRQLGDSSYINQANPGGPVHLRVQVNPFAATAITAFQIAVSWDNVNYIFLSGTGFGGQATAAAQQAQLDTYVAALNAGTA